MAALLSNRSLILIKGSDARVFLQNLLTNDINSEESFYSYILSAQGRFLFDVFVVKFQDGYLLDIFSGTKEELVDKLDMYSINQDVEIEDFDQAFRAYYSREYQENHDIIYKDSRYVSLGYRFISDKSIRSDNSYLEDKYKYTIPDGGVDILYEKSIAPEYGPEELKAVSFTKGCYVGQEVMSRTKYQGEVRKHLYKIESDTDLDDIQHGAEISQNGKKIGRFCSGYGKLGIGLLRSQNISEEGELILENKVVIANKAEWYDAS